MLMPAMCHQLGIFLDYKKVVLVFHYCFDIQSLLWRTGLTVGDGSHLVQYLYQIWCCAWMFPFNILSLMFWRRVPNLGAPFLKLPIFPLVVHYCETHCIDLQKLVCHETWENCFILLFCLLPTSTHAVSYSTGQSSASWFRINLKKSGNGLETMVFTICHSSWKRTVKHHGPKENKIKPLLVERQWE